MYDDKDFLFEIEFYKKLFVAQVYIDFLPSFTKASFIPALPAVALRGGVTGRELLNEGVFAFFSDGFKIWKLHISVSSTDIIAPALSNSPQ